MGKEIERKFLVRDDAWRDGVVRRLTMCQGYLAGGPRASVRVRAAGDEAWLNVKSGGLVAVRQEFEYRIPASDAGEMLDTLCERPLVEKTRHWVPFGGFEWEVDVFHGANDGLIVALRAADRYLMRLTTQSATADVDDQPESAAPAAAAAAAPAR